jgi:hypothetical protein
MLAVDFHLPRRHPVAMFWHALSVLLSPLYVVVTRLTWDDRDRTPA